ncbi:hypothetical protein HIM_02411 [Hirsutella minnesotensis 3608]|nr:hypothetical protein HIM_02411 [Hirsutella minnesotensis 3608]
MHTGPGNEDEKALARSDAQKIQQPDTCHDSPRPRLPPWRQAKVMVKDFYEAVIVDFFLRRRRLERSKDGRSIPLAIQHEEPLIDLRRGHAYISNNVRTSRYTVWDFIPKQLFFQFSRIGNFYFLCVGIPQTIPGLSTTGSYTTILPLLFFVLLTIAKEGLDDYRRHRLDNVENANSVTILGRHDKGQSSAVSRLNLLQEMLFRTKSSVQRKSIPNDEFDGIKWLPARWSHVKVGDVVWLSRDEKVPADLVLLHSEGEDGIAYIDTMALDGETNLKTKQVCPALDRCDSIEAIATCRAQFVIEDPNPDLFTFNGRVTLNDKTAPLTLEHVVNRGSIMRNTRSVIGLVINTGEECKVRMNSNQHPHAKRPALEMVVNMVVITLAIYVILLSLGVSLGYLQWQKTYEHGAWYLDDAAVPFHQIIIAFIIMFNNVVPLSLYISLEVVKIGQVLLLNSDHEMYHEETDTPARCNTNTILENLGQIGYVFSDKTGTLTDNIMKFRKMSVAGTVWLHETDLETRDYEELAPSGTCKNHPAWRRGQDKTDTSATVIPENDHVVDPESTSSPRPSFEKRSSPHWRLTSRPDHSQPELNTSTLLEYMRLRPHSAFSRKAREYLLAVALCHTCLPETRQGEIDFQASSPDELALVRAAQELGYSVIQRTSQAITLQVPWPSGSSKQMVFQILDIINFSSARKRMSIIVRHPDGRISIICKGADSAILPRLKLSSLAMQTASEVRKSADLEHEMHRRSEQQEPRNSFGGRPSLTLRQSCAPSREPDAKRRPGIGRSQSLEIRKLARSSVDRVRTSNVLQRGASLDVSRTHLAVLSANVSRQVPERLKSLEDPGLFNDSEVFARCFEHLEDFAMEGLRTLLYAQRTISEQEYLSWKRLYNQAATSLTDRQERIEAAGDMIEQSLELVGATAIEDKLQKGVPETIDRLRRANIKIWMLTGDKRETAINIAHSARICRPASDVFIIDNTKSALGSQLMAVAEDLQTDTVHSVIVVDGQTLAEIEASDELSQRFFAIAMLVDSVICCRASPAQKALLVRAVRARSASLGDKHRRGLTLAIGDGANDLAMIQASHVGVGISGREGLQAARVADYAIAQFRFLQRLLLVHGRWNYVRTAKFILCTFWKEMFFYLPTAQYQRYAGYSGTSLYHETSLTVFNTLFTSLCTVCMGIWEQDLDADTLLAVPELYVYGQRNLGLNMYKFARWMLLAAVEGVAVWYGVWAGYGWVSPGARDEGLYALGMLAFTIGVLWINWKLFIMETHHKTSIVLASFFVTTLGWFAWIAMLDGALQAEPSGPYAIRHTFRNAWGRDPAWWSTVFIVLAALGLADLCVRAARRWAFPAGPWPWHWPPWNRPGRRRDNVEEWDVPLWQELEQDPAMRERLRILARDGDDASPPTFDERQGSDEDAASTGV